MTDAASFCFPPVAAPDIEILILGSLPGEASLARAQYYGHPRNQFWRLIGEAVQDAELPLMEYHDRLDRLRHHKVGLWDVVASAVRPGSLDQHMRDIISNSLTDFVSAFHNLRVIGFNGTTASKIGQRQLPTHPMNASGQAIEVLMLPSSSPANTMGYPLKAQAWRQLTALTS